MTDSRSELTAQILKANPNAYESLVVSGGTPVLARKLLKDVRPEQLAEGPANTRAMLAGLWLWHDGLGESHKISQEMHDATGSFWHAILHRREGDFSNSKYWYARAAGHPVLGTLAGQANAIVNGMPADRLLLRIVAKGFDPNALVDLAEEAYEREDDPRREVALQLQQLEWRMLFEWCAR